MLTMFVRGTTLGVALALLTACGEEFSATPDAGPAGGSGGTDTATTSSQAGSVGTGGRPGDGGAGGTVGTGGTVDTGGSGAGGGPPPGPKRVFVSSEAFPGGGRHSLSGLDDFCASLATQSTIGGSWVAWASTDDGTTAHNAVERIAGNGPWILVNGTPVFENREQFLNGPSHALDHTEFGSQTSAEPTDVWTGSFAEGTASGNDCQLWTSSNAGFVGLAGDYTSTGASWTEAGPLNCDQPARVYCFEL
jgi:hypothetical protein